jgi:hypothetical protein
VRIPRTGGLLALVLAACFQTAQIHDSLGNAYGEARTVAVAPPMVDIRALIGRGAEFRWDLSSTVDQRLTAALRAAFEQRGLRVVLLEDSPQTADPLYDVRSSFEILLPSLVNAPTSTTSATANPYFDFWLGDVAGLLDAAGADLLVLASAKGEALTTEGVRSGVMAQSPSAGSGPAEFLDVYVALVDRTGQVIFFNWCRSSSSPLSPGEVVDAVERTLKKIPRRS